MGFFYYICIKQIILKMQVTKQQQAVSDSISKLMGSLSHMTYVLDKLKNHNPRNVYRFELKHWGENITKKYYNGIVNTFDDISKKYPIFADLLERSNIYLDYYITNRKMLQVKEINNLFGVYQHNPKLYNSIVFKINKKALSTNIKFKNDDYQAICSLYVALSFVKHAIDTCLDKTVVYLTKDFKNCVNKGLNIISKQIHSSDIEYYDKATKTVYNVDCNTLFSISDLALAYNNDQKSLLGIIKQMETA